MGGLAEASSGCEVIARHERAGEVVQFALLERREGSLILCRSEGELTKEIFDAPWHVGAVFVDKEQLSGLCRLLAGPLSDGGASLGALLRGVLAEENVQFSDLLDLMDAADIPYEYRAFVPDMALFRPERGAA